MDDINKRLLINILVALPHPLAGEQTDTDLPRDDNATPR